MATSGCVSTPSKQIDGISNHISSIKVLKLEEGSISYEDSMGNGTAIICIPGMGDTRGQFRLLAPQLVAAGFRVITVDPRGQGDSDATFSKYSASSVGEDVIKLIDQLNTNVYLLGNSSGGASAAWVASYRPQKVKGIVFLAAFLRDHPLSFFNRLMLQTALRGPWAESAWISFYKSIFVTQPPIDQENYTTALKQSLNQPGHILALRQMVFASKNDVEDQLKKIRAPILAIGGSKDPDFDNPGEELNWILSEIHGEKAMIEGAGHYPHLEYPDQVLKLVQKFVANH